MSVYVSLQQDTGSYVMPVIPVVLPQRAGFQ